MIVKVFIQNEKGSKFRNKYNEETLEYIKQEELLIPAQFQYGFIPGTLGEDGDCIDIWLISKNNFVSGSIVNCKVLGMLEMYEEYHGEYEEDFKVFVCPEAEETIVKDETVSIIKNFTLEIFKKFPEVTITFGTFQPAEKAESFISNASGDSS